MVTVTKARFLGWVSPWEKAVAATVSAIVAVLLIYRETFLAMVSIWWNSTAFTHCFMILPISAYLIWRRRSALSELIPNPDYRALAVLALLGFGWLFASLADVNFVAQYAAVAMIPMLTWAILGWYVVREIAFPLGFLLFSVPVGDFLVPRMIEFTADFTVGMLNITGIPVFREGPYFSIPSGDWSVIEACAGLRYLIASVTLGSLFAYLNFRSTGRRVLFVLLSVIVPVIANGFRAYMIVMIGHLSGMTLAMGVDHFIYGWVFFGIVMALLFWLGSRWSDEGDPESVADELAAPREPRKEGRMLLVVVCALLVVAIWPIRAAHLKEVSIFAGVPVTITAPEARPPWRRADAMTVWNPSYLTAHAHERAFYTDGKHTVGVFIEYYRQETQGRELVNSQNVLVPENDPNWKMLEERPSVVTMEAREVNIMQGLLRSGGQELMTWRWNWVSGQFLANKYLSKIFQAVDKLMGRNNDSAAIILSVETADDMHAARDVLQNFTDGMLGSIRQTLEETAKQIPN